MYDLIHNYEHMLIEKGKYMQFFISLVLLCFSLSANAFEITGAGASFPEPVYSSWLQEYYKATGNKVNYQSIGSSGGIRQINSKTVDFGASDEAVKQTKLDEKGQIQFPAVKGAVVVVVNLPGVKSNTLNLTSKQVAEIFSNKITNWQQVDPNLPNTKITLIVRADGSGTTSIFTNWLASVLPEFKKEIGVGKTVKWKDGHAAGKGNAGVAAMISRIPSSIGYIEYAYATKGKLVTTMIDNKAPNFESFVSNSWPLTAETFIIVYPNDKAKDVVKFFEWCFTNGDNSAKKIDYVPLSDKRKSEVRNLWKKYNLM